MSDTYSDWENPRNEPWFQGQPTQQDIYANRYGQGFGNSGYDSPQDEVDARFDQLKEYFKMTGTWLPDRIPGIPDIVEKPDTSTPLYSSSFVDTYRNDQSYNRVYQLIEEENFGFDQAVAAVMEEAELQGWAMPLQADAGDERMTFNTTEQNWELAPTVAQYEAEQAYLAAGGEMGEDGKPPRKRGDNSGMDGADPSGQAYPEFRAPRNINESLFASNALKFVEGRQQENRAYLDRESALQAYADNNAPRYSFDYQGMMENGASAGLRKTDYYAQEQTPAETRPPGRPRGTAAPVRQSRPRSDRRGGGVETRTQQFERDQSAADRTNEKNRSDNEKFQAAYRANLTEYAQGQGALPSERQQAYAMMDDYLASFIYGGGQ
jgi:hypothetical protein